MKIQENDANCHTHRQFIVFIPPPVFVFTQRRVDYLCEFICRELSKENVGFEYAQHFIRVTCESLT